MSKVRLTLLLLLTSILPGSARAQAIVVDHNSLALFDQIPEQYLQAARDLRLLFMDRSVGVNTNDGLDCFTGSSYGSTRVTCRRDYRESGGSWELILRDDSDLASGLVPDYIAFDPSPTRYNRSNWDFYIFADSWSKMATDFITGLNNGSIPAENHLTGGSVSLNPLAFDVLSFQFSYLNIDHDSTIMDFFTQLPGDFDDVYDLEREVAENLTSANPPRVFVYWTTSLSRALGSQVGTSFNQQMRQWCRDNNKILFDFADIQAYDMFGQPCYDNRDGVPFTTPSGNNSENHPNDGLNTPAICQEKTTETDGGHLGTAQGVVSVSKGMWILMAQIAGWSPSGETPPSAPANLRIVE